MPFFDTKDGPIVIEIPPADDGVDQRHHHGCLADAARGCGPAGVDKGKGGKYLIVPPDYKDKLPAGYIVLRVEHVSGLRAAALDSRRAAAMPTSQRPWATASGSSSIRSSQAAKPPATTFLDAVDVVYDATIPTTCASSSRSTASCSASCGSRATRR